MTNKEWLMSLTDYDCALFCIEYLPLIGRDSMSSVYSVSQWLGFEYNPKYYVVEHFNEILELRKITQQHKEKGENK